MRTGNVNLLAEIDGLAQMSGIETDELEVVKLINKLEKQVKGIKIETLIALRDSIQPDGLINSDEGTKTIMAITNAINKIINSEIELTPK